MSHHFFVRSKVKQKPRALEILAKPQFLQLLASTTLAELAGNIIYVVLLEQAYRFGGTSGVGVVLLVQGIPQVLLGMWVGSLVDRLGKKQAAVWATVANATLGIGIFAGQTLLSVYLLAFLIMLARLFLFPARLALVSHTSSKTNLVGANSAISMVSGLGLLIGPALSAAIILHTEEFKIPLLVAGTGLLLSILPLLFIPGPEKETRFQKQVGIREELRIGKQFILQKTPIRRTLMCLVHVTMVMGTVMPLLTPLAHDLGLGAAGSSVFYTAVGFGGLIGVFVTAALAARLNPNPSVIILLSGILVPLGELLIGMTENKLTVFVAIALIHSALASLNLIAITILQRLTPMPLQGYVFGVVQTLLGIAWIISLATMTTFMAIWSQNGVNQSLFLYTGSAGIMVILTCWYRYRHQINALCRRCELNLQILGILCQTICHFRSLASGAAYRLLQGIQA